MSLKSALQITRYYTGGTWQLSRLRGYSMRGVRRTILEAITGKVQPPSRCGIGRVEMELYAELNCSGCAAEKQKQFTERAEIELRGE